MKVQSQEIKQLNITAVLTETNDAFITAEKMREVFELSEKEKNQSPFIEFSPKVKVFGMPQRQKAIIMEEKRLRVNDTSGLEPSSSELINYFWKVLNKLADKGKLAAYGFNYDVLIKIEGKIDFPSFLGKTLLGALVAGDILESGTRVIYTKDEKRYDLRITPTGEPSRAAFHLNVHCDSPEINLSRLKTQFGEGYLELKRIIDML